MSRNAPVLVNATPRETPSERTKRLHVEVKEAAREQMGAFIVSLSHLVSEAQEIADGGECFPAGVRDLAKRLGEDLRAKAVTLGAIVEGRR